MRLEETAVKAGTVATQPLVWAAITALLAFSGGDKGRRAALRGALGYLMSSTIANGLKPIFSRPQPRHRKVQKPQVAKAAFPSGHGAAELAYTYGAALEDPRLRLPLGALAILAHFSQVRSGKHYRSDMLAGKAIGLIVVALTKKVWAPGSSRVVFLRFRRRVPGIVEAEERHGVAVPGPTPDSGVV